MNFYKAQDDAHKKTKILVFYYFLAVLATIISMHLAVSLIRLLALSSTLRSAHYNESTSFVEVSYLDALLDPIGALLVMGGTAVLIFGGWLFKSIEISGGGETIARSLGARLVDPNTRDSEEKQLINVVEEMAISSGLPVPQVWLMDNDQGINAFAAGSQPGNAVIGVTRGTMQRLNRAELQGVIAHEFSHILNGDMRMNGRLLSMLHGLLLISILGYSLMRLAYFSSSSRSRDREGNNLGVALILIAISMIIIGSVGAFFASMIQAAISRQREYLADASAVEFTMDPSGISGALKKIGGSSYGANVSSAKAVECEHMFLAPSGMFRFGMASHPPLAERIQLIEPNWAGEFSDSSIRTIEQQHELRNTQQQAAPPMNEQFSQVLTGVMLEGAIGESGNAKLSKGQSISDRISQKWLDAAHDKHQAQLMIFGMLIAVDGGLQQTERAKLNEEIGTEMAQISVHWHTELKDLHSTVKIALLDICVPSLRQLGRLEYERFIELTHYLIESDSRVDLFEFMLQKVLQRHLDAHFIRQASPSVKYYKINDVLHEVNVILSTIAGVGGHSLEGVQSAYKAATVELSKKFTVALSLLPPEECGVDKIELAIERLEKASSIVKKELLDSCIIAINHDEEVTSEEAELLRATADALGCTIAPFI